MSKILKSFFICILFFYASFSFAIQDNYTFETPAQQERFQEFTSQLRCLVCQNQNIAESNAALANDLRDKVYQLMQQGKTNQEIADYLVTRYSSYILYQPPFNPYTLALWLAPFLLGIFGVSYLLFYLRKSKQLC
jgi:cytochrome c-type biogenesis protein CcmH